MAIQETLAVRAAEVRDLRRIRLFLDAEMRQGGWPCGPDEDLLRWKFFAGPEPAPCYAAFDAEGCLVGFSGSVARRMWIDGREHRVTEGTDAFISRSYWGLHAALEMRDLATRDHIERGYALRYGQPNPTALRSALRLGYTRLGATVRWTRPLSAKMLRGRWPAAAVTLARGPVALASRASLLPARVAAAGLRLKSLGRFDERTDLLWESARSRYDAIVVRDSAYMNWRYAESPLHYSRLGAFRRGKLVGVAIGRVDSSAGGAPVMNVADVLTGADDRGRIAYALIGRLLREAHRHGCALAQADRSEAAAARGNDPVAAALRAHGFCFKREVGATIVRTFADAPGVRKLVDRGGWAYQSGDSDQG